MPPKIIKFDRNAEVVEVIRELKKLKDNELILVLDKESDLFSNPNNLKLIKKTAEALGKKIKISTDEADFQPTSRLSKPAARVARSDIKPRFSDIMGPRKISVAKSVAKKEPISLAKHVFSVMPKFELPIRQTEKPANPKANDRTRRVSSRFSRIFIFILVILIVGVFALAVMLPKATITIFARSEPVNRDFEFIVDKNIAIADSDKLQIPGISVSREISQTKSFPVNGVKLTGTKATGFVIIKNTTQNTIKLKASTTTLLANGKKYFLIKDAAGIKGNGAVNVPVSIEAEKAGDDYNLPANTKFQIVNTALGNTNEVSATNPQALSGGNATSTKALSQEDLDKATNSLLGDLVTQAEDDLTKENSTQIKLFDSGLKKEILAKTANIEIGDEADNFNMTIIVRITGLATRLDDIVSMVLMKINQVLSTDKYLLNDKKQVLTGQFKTLDIPNAHGVLDVHFETLAAYKVDNSNLTKILAGKNEMDIKEILLSKPEVDDVKIEFWPSWLVNKAPKLNGKIYINTVLSK